MKTPQNHTTPSTKKYTDTPSSADNSFGIARDQFQLLRAVEGVCALGGLLHEIPVLRNSTRENMLVLELEDIDASLLARLSSLAENLSIPTTSLSELVLQTRFGGFLIPEALVLLSSRNHQQAPLSLAKEVENLPSHYQRLLSSLSRESTLVAGATGLALVHLHSSFEEGATNPAFAHQLSTLSQIAAAFEAVHSFVDFFTRMQGSKPTGIEPYVLNSLRTGLTRPLVELSFFAAAQSARVVLDGYTPAASFYLAQYRGVENQQLCEVNDLVVELSEKHSVISRLFEYYEKTGRDTITDDAIRVPQMVSASDSYRAAIWYRKSFEALTKQIAQPNNRRLEKLYDSTVLRITGGTDLYLCNSTDSSGEVGIRVRFGRGEYSPLLSVVSNGEEGFSLQYAPLPPYVVVTGLRGALARQGELFDEYSKGRAAIGTITGSAVHDKKQQLTALANKMTILPATESEHNEQILRVLTALSEVGFVAGVHGIDEEDSATRSLLGNSWLAPSHTSLNQIVEDVVAQYARRIASMTNE